MNDQTLETQKFFGSVKKIIFKSVDGDFKIGVLEAPGGRELTFKGAMPGLVQGQQIWVLGIFEKSPSHGVTFKVNDFGWDRPTDPLGIERYLASGFFKGIGPALAQALVKHFGVETLKIVEEGRFELIARVPKVGLARAKAICQGAIEHRHISEIMVFLRAHQVSTLMAKKIYQKLGAQAVPILEQNPYVLMDLVEGVGFKKADEIAANFGVQPQDPMRIFFAMKFSLWQEFKCGNVYLTVAQFLKLVEGLLAFDKESQGLLLEQLNLALTRSEFVVFDNSGAGFLLLERLESFEKGDLIIGLKKGFAIEQTLAGRIKQFSSGHCKVGFDQNQLYKEFSASLVSHGKRFELTDEQKEALCSILAVQSVTKKEPFNNNKISVITGGPGTGKTTILRALVLFLKKHKIRFEIAAPTGKAAKRVSQTSGTFGKTIHRLLEYDPVQGVFVKNDRNALKLDLLIIDETSMVDLFLANAIFKSLPSNAKVLFLGDVDQLPSIGPGQFFSDLINSGAAKVVRLTKIFRQASDSQIIIAAHKINASEIPNLTRTENSDFMFYNSPAQEGFLAIFDSIFTDLAFRGIDHKDWIVLTPMHRGIAGSKNINQYLQARLNPLSKAKEVVTYFDHEFRVGDPVMQIKNNYDKEVFNGDVGRIVEIVDQNELVVDFDSKQVKYGKFELRDLSLAYAASIHKSQGSEFKAVTIPIFMQHYHLLAKRLIYTAVTRAKNFCSIVGQKQALAAAIKGDKNQVRITLLVKMLV